NIGGKHLHEAIRESRFEDTSRNGLKWHLKTEIGPLPPLFSTILKPPERFCILGTVPYSTLCPIHLYVPGIRFTRRQPFHFQQHGHFLTTDFHRGAQRCIIPRITRSNPAF